MKNFQYPKLQGEYLQPKAMITPLFIFISRKKSFINWEFKVFASKKQISKTKISKNATNTPCLQILSSTDDFSKVNENNVQLSGYDHAV